MGKSANSHEMLNFHSTYHASLICFNRILMLMQVFHYFIPDLSAVVLISIFLDFKALLSDLLVVHGVRCLVDRVGARDFFHRRFRSLLTDIESDLGDVFNLGLDKLLMVRWRSKQGCIDSLYDTHITGLETVGIYQ